MTDANSSAINETRISMVKDLRQMAGAALQNKDLEKAHDLLRKAKSLKIPLKNIDYLRALVFIKKSDPGSAREALKEELRYFPDNDAASKLLQEIDGASSRPALNDKEFQQLYNIVQAYTMVPLPRLQSLYQHAREVCLNGPSGNFVECGVAGGGSSGLLSAIIKSFDPSRKLFACDSFDGMPPATEFDTHAGQDAESTGWGTGTCAAPESSVLELCKKLGTESVITTVKGYFEETLPQWKDKFGPIAFLHMDGDWYSSTKAILDNLYDKLAPDAYVQVDDFNHWDGCRKAMVEFFNSRKIEIDAYGIDGEGIWFRKP